MSTVKRKGAPIHTGLLRLLQYLITEWLPFVQVFSRVELTNYPVYHYVCGITQGSGREGI